MDEWKGTNGEGEMKRDERKRMDGEGWTGRDERTFTSPHDDAARGRPDEDKTAPAPSHDNMTSGAWDVYRHVRAVVNLHIR